MATTGHWVRRRSTIVLYGAEGDRDDDATLEDPLAREDAFALETGMPTLRRGSTGAAVRHLQTRLKALGNDLFDPGSIDGVFGARTAAPSGSSSSLAS